MKHPLSGSCKIAFTSLILALLAPRAVAAQVRSPSSQELEDFDAWVVSYLEEAQIPGALFAVASRGNFVRLQTYGLSNVELRTPVTDSTVFEIGSISKQFVAAATMLLVEEERLALDDPIHHYLPDLPGEWIGVTIRQLLTHTSGIPDYELIRSYDAYRFRMTPDEVIHIAHSRPMDFEPGTGWFYSNTGYYLLSMIVERIEGSPIGDVLHARIFRPLGMGQTRMTAPEDIIPHRAAGYWVDVRDRLINRAPTETSSTLGAGGVLSSVRDLVKWDEALYSERLLSEESKAMMWTPAVLPDGADTQYGFGWALGDFRGAPAQTHSGQVAGFSSRIVRIPGDEIVLLAFINRYKAAFRTLFDRFADLYVGSP